MCSSKEDYDESQLFLVLDRRILLELEDPSFEEALYYLISIHFSFDLEYKASQKYFYTFLEEFCLGILPKKKTKKYRSVVQGLYDEC